VQSAPNYFPEDFGPTTLRARISERMQPGAVCTTLHHVGTGANVVTIGYADWRILGLGGAERARQNDARRCIDTQSSIPYLVRQFSIWPLACGAFPATSRKDCDRPLEEPGCEQNGVLDFLIEVE
jgi:hypothetical protein